MSKDDKKNGQNVDLNQADEQLKTTESDQVILALTADLQRQRADFENYRKRVDGDLKFAKKSGEKNFAKKVLPLLDVFDSIFRGLENQNLDQNFAKGVQLAKKNFDKTLSEMDLEKMNYVVGDEFDHEKMFAISADETEGETEVISEILQPGYIYGGEVLRPAMVKITRK